MNPNVSERRWIFFYQILSTPLQKKEKKHEPSKDTHGYTNVSQPYVDVLHRLFPECKPAVSRIIRNGLLLLSLLEHNFSSR